MYSPLISQTMKTGDWLFAKDHADHTDAIDTEAARAELIAEITDDRFKAKLARLDPVDFLAALESFTRAEAPAAFAMFLADPQGFRDMLVGKMIKEMKDAAEVEAVLTIERIESEVEYFCRG